MLASGRRQRCFSSIFSSAGVGTQAGENMVFRAGITHVGKACAHVVIVHAVFSCFNLFANCYQITAKIFNSFYL